MTGNVADFAHVLRSTNAGPGATGRFEIHRHRFGLDAVLGPAETAAPAHEVGMMADVVAETQESSHDVADDLLTRIRFRRYPGQYMTAGNTAATLSPAVPNAGPVFGFSIYHRSKIADPAATFQITWLDAGRVQETKEKERTAVARQERAVSG